MVSGPRTGDELEEERLVLLREGAQDVPEPYDLLVRGAVVEVLRVGLQVVHCGSTGQDQAHKGQPLCLWSCLLSALSLCLCM